MLELFALHNSSSNVSLEPITAAFMRDFSSWPTQHVRRSHVRLLFRWSIYYLENESRFVLLIWINSSLVSELIWPSAGCVTKADENLTRRRSRTFNNCDNLISDNNFSLSHFVGSTTWTQLQQSEAQTIPFSSMKFMRRKCFWGFT